jgi:hypothetical protein
MATITIERKIRFVTSDGQEFKTQEKAMNYKTLMDLAEQYEDDPIYGRIEGSRIDWEDFLEWCRDHEKLLSSLVQVL